MKNFGSYLTDIIFFRKTDSVIYPIMGMVLWTMTIITILWIIAIINQSL